MHLGDEIRATGLVVLEGRARGRGTAPRSIEIERSGTDKDADPAEVINAGLLADKYVAVIERSGRVWLFAEGPLVGTAARLLLLGPDKGKVPAAQQEAADTVAAVLEGRYEISAADGAAEPADAADGDLEAAEEGQG